MENTVKYPLFVEFYGLPGCGKSTVSHMVAERLRVTGHQVDEPSYYIDHLPNIFLRKIKKLHYFFTWFIGQRGLFRKIKSIVVDNGYSGKSCLRQIVNIIQKIRIYRHKSSSQFVIWDQGLAQAAISLSVNGKKSAAKNLRNLYSLLPSSLHIIHILIDTNIELALSRMSSRNSNDSRVEQLNNQEEKDKMLQCFQDGVASISTRFAKSCVDGTDDLENQVAHVLHIIIRQA